MFQHGQATNCASVYSSNKPTNNTPNSKPLDRDPSKLRSACDGCHAAKIRCTGETPCARCARENLLCHYSCKAKIGKPKGSMNKKTIERLQQMKQAEEQRNCVSRTPPSTAGGDTRSTTPCAAIVVSPPNRDGNPTFSIPQSPPDTQESPDNQSSTSFTFDFSSSENLILLADELHGMDDWLPTTADNSIENDCLRVSNSSTPPRMQSVSRPMNSEVSEENGDDPMFGSERPALGKISAVESAFPLFPLHSLKSTMSHTPETLYNISTLPVHPNLSLLNSLYPNSSTCTCFCTLSNHLCTLQTTSHTSRQIWAIDILLIQSQHIIPAIRNLLGCQYCMKETQALFLVGMILSRLLRWSQVSVQAYGPRCVPAQVQLGTYCISGEFGVSVTRLLIQTHYMHLKTTVEVFQHRVDNIGFEGEEIAYLSLQGRNFQKDIEKLTGLPNAQVQDSL